MKWDNESIEAKIKFMIAFTFCTTVLVMVGLSMFSIVFVPQPMNGIAPADKQFFYLLSDMSKYILGSLGTLLAIKGKDVVQEMLKKEPTDDPPTSADGSREQDSGQGTPK
ncbi:hypothetical protein EBT31_00430 [bacterium]|jgi:hypothetical protein|nr:hypothetical protein [bacterium]